MHSEANPLDSYLNIDRIISAAKVTESNVIHWLWFLIGIYEFCESR